MIPSPSEHWYRSNSFSFSFLKYFWISPQFLNPANFKSFSRMRIVRVKTNWLRMKCESLFSMMIKLVKIKISDLISNGNDAIYNYESFTYFMFDVFLLIKAFLNFALKALTFYWLTKIY